MKYDKVYLRKRPQYDEMIDEIELKQPKIKYPDRVAQFMRNTPYLSQFDGEQSFINMEEQESNMAKEQVLQQAIRLMAGRNGSTHASIRARTSMASGSDRPSYPTPSEYESPGDSDFTGYADSEIQRRILHTRARNELMAAKAQQDLDEQHIKQTAKGLFDTDSETDPFKSEASYVGRSVKERHVREILNDVIDNVLKSLVVENKLHLLHQQLFIQQD